MNIKKVHGVSAFHFEVFSQQGLLFSCLTQLGHRVQTPFRVDKQNLDAPRRLSSHQIKFIAMNTKIDSPDTAASTSDEDDGIPRLLEAKLSEEEEYEEVTLYNRAAQGLTEFYHKYEFPLLILCSIVLAHIYPRLGAKFFQPEITASWIAVMLVFLLSGLSLKTEEFSRAFQRFNFNGFVQFFNFVVVSLLVFGATRVLAALRVLDQPLADGMVILSCLAMAINSAIILTVAAGGDEAAAVFNATFGNIIGIFLSPVMILLFLGTSGDIPLSKVFSKLLMQVVFPLVVGQLIQKFSRTVQRHFAHHKRRYKKMQEYCLIYIVYTVFCRTFFDDAAAGTSMANVFIMIAIELLLALSFMILAWYSLAFLFPDEPELRVMGLFGCVQKTVAVGIPLISSIYESSPNEGLYTLPLLVWHPMQLVIGSLLVPRLHQFVTSERKRLDQEASRNASSADDVEHSLQKVTDERVHLLTTHTGLSAYGSQ